MAPMSQSAASPESEKENHPLKNTQRASNKKEMAGSESGIPGKATELETNGSISDSELDRQALGPSSAVEEEAQLRQQRAEAEAKAVQAMLASGQAALLDDKKFSQLEKLLSQTDMYSKFLSEQMQGVEEATDNAASSSATAQAAGKAGGKRKAGARAHSGASKKAKSDVKSSPTKDFLPLIQGELRDYQLKGVKWMNALYQNGLNGILADQMGLGKTVQTIGFLSHLWSKGIYGPFMIIGPLSTLPNWLSEFERWCPTIPAVLYHGSRNERHEILRKRCPKDKVNNPVFPAIITSYEIVLADVKLLQKYKFKYIIVDEGHRLKNMNCKLLRELRTIPTDNKLLLSGTPLQNNLAELWSMLNFLLPDVFSSLADFEAWFDFSSVVGSEAGNAEIMLAEQRNRVVSKLHSILKPFLLRRIKSDVEASLPARKEIIMYAGMSDLQKKINQDLLDKTLEDNMIKRALEKGGTSASVGKLNNVLMQMRKNCNHPDLITSAFENSLLFPTPEELTEQCGKMALLDRLLTHLHAHGHKVLVFSQMTRMLDLLESYLEQLGHRACRIDGSVSWQDRQESMRAFNTDPEVFCFLLSTRAGGLGINLTAADTVIIYDSDWNPHQDLQAMDRCHRIGQQKPVLVFRLATANSVEGKMLKRAAGKLMLEKLIIKKGAFLDHGAAAEETKASSMKADELLELLKPDVSLQDDSQSGVVSEAMLKKLLDRKHMVQGKPAPYGLSGVGYEVVQQMDGSGLLKGVE